MSTTQVILLSVGGAYCFITCLIYWLMVLRNFAPSGVKTLDIMARLFIVIAPLLIPFAIIKAIFQAIFTKEKNNDQASQ